LKPTISIRKALNDPNLLGSVLGGTSWASWRTILIAAMGEGLTHEERQRFKQLTGRANEPMQRVEELAVVAGRRGGKSRAMSTLAAYMAGLCQHNLVRGEKGVALCIAPDERQAAIVLDYCHAAFEESPVLAQMIQNRTSSTLELTNGVVIETRAASFRRLRGPTYVAVIADEAAFWFSDDHSSNTDAEILNSVRPGLATTKGLLILCSSPHARRGELWETYNKHYGQAGDPLILVAQGPTTAFNPDFPQSVIDRALEKDPAKNRAEYLAQFRSDVETFVTLEVVQSCTGDHIELMPDSRHSYHAFVDPSGGSKDAFTLAISHREGEQIIIDAVRERHPPFSPEQVIIDFANLLKTYRVSVVTGDRYGGEFPREHFRKQGIAYRCAEKTKSELYRDFLPLLNSRRVTLPRNERLLSQFVGLERTIARGGRDSIDHAKHGHDDLCNAAAGAAAQITFMARVQPVVWGDYGSGFIRMHNSHPKHPAHVVPGTVPDTADHREKLLPEGLVRRTVGWNIW
jgi:hypothetical protein